MRRLGGDTTFADGDDMQMSGSYTEYRIESYININFYDTPMVQIRKFINIKEQNIKVVIWEKSY